VPTKSTVSSGEPHVSRVRAPPSGVPTPRSTPTAITGPLGGSGTPAHAANANGSVAAPSVEPVYMNASVREGGRGRGSAHAASAAPSPAPHAGVAVELAVGAAEPLGDGVLLGVTLAVAVDETVREPDRVAGGVMDGVVLDVPVAVGVAEGVREGDAPRDSVGDGVLVDVADGEPVPDGVCDGGAYT